MIFFKLNIPSRMKQGLVELRRSPCKLGIFILYLLFWIRHLYLTKAVTATGLTGIIEHAKWFLMLFYSFVGCIFILIMLGIPLHIYKIKHSFATIGLKNSTGEIPSLLNCEKSKKTPGMKILYFQNCGIPLETWHDKSSAIEAALNVRITRIDYGDSFHEVILETAPYRKLPEQIRWKDKYLSEKDFELVLGTGYLQNIIVDLNKVPHILLGGSTGSGKSVLLKLLLMQSIKKGASVYIADFKGGVDFSPAWHENCTIITAVTELLNVLVILTDELQNRKILLRESGCTNLTEYNATHEKHLKRCIFACDEVAEVLDKTGLTKEQKELVTKIEGKLSIIARQGRAFGIHLILATQRPDANILSGQIRNNIGYRVCGRSDYVLSQIILDNTEAANKIPKDSQGLFINHERIVFRAFYFDDWENPESINETYVILEDDEIYDKNKRRKAAQTYVPVQRKYG